MLNLIGEGITKGAKELVSGAAEKATKNAALDSIDDLSKVSLSSILKMAGKTPERTVDSVRSAVLDTLSNPKVDKRIRTELYNRTPFAARVWNNSNRVNELPRKTMYRSNALQGGIDLDNILQQYADSEGGMSTITLTDLDRAFGTGYPVYTGKGDMYTPYSDEGARAMIEWANREGKKRVQRGDLRNKYWNPIVEGMDNPENSLEKVMNDWETRRVGDRYDEFVSLAGPDEAIGITRKDFIPDATDWSSADAEDIADSYREMLLNRFTQRGGRGRAILEKSVPGLALLLGGGAIMGSNKKEEN